ncbi:hypothetical protein OIU77_011159 [Salix suchowensis]|uniref:Uncharacterized protein n=1 Tax=Salix suchowensis TaxID=1278906 RepID=A0ABQ9ABB0_9ROSI|nr:hypothetical protein OIU77_011159 [Salix suchowensis]
MARKSLGQARSMYKAMVNGWRYQYFRPLDKKVTEPVGGRLSYEPPINDINAPDLYIPCMAFATYLVLAGISLGLSGKLTPEALNWKFVTGMMGWFSELMLLKVSILFTGRREAPLLDMVAYAGYTFTGMCVAVLGKITLGYTYYLIIFCGHVFAWAYFFIKTMKRISIV